MVLALSLLLTSVQMPVSAGQPGGEAVEVKAAEAEAAGTQTAVPADSKAEDVLAAETQAEEAEAAEKALLAGVTLLEGEEKLAAATLETDLTLKGNYVFDSGTLDLNGHKLTIEGNLLHTEGDILVNGGSLLVTGDYRIQYRKDDGTYTECGAALVMTDENDEVAVGGDFYVSGDNGYWNRKGEWQKEMLTAGTLTIGKGLHQLYRSDGFRAMDAHRIILAGKDGKSSVSFESPYSCLGILEMAEGADIDWTGFFNVETLGNDVTIRTAEEGIRIYSEHVRMNFNGKELVVNGDVKDLVGQLFVGGAYRTGEAFGPAKAGSLVINGDFLQQDGDLVADGGKVHVSGDWRIQYRKDDDTYTECGAYLCGRKRICV